MRLFSLLFVALLLAACERPPDAPDWSLSMLDSPAGAGAVAPNLAAGRNGTVLMSWTEPRERGHALLFSRLDGEAWASPREIAAGEGWFVNWADFPAVAELEDGTLVAHWLEKSGPATYAYDVVVTRSHDGGESWTAGERPHTDGTQTEHGFVSLLPVAADRVLIVWLDGRETGGGTHHAGSHGDGGPMTLRTRTLTGDGDWGEELLLDGMVCDCCQTSAVITPRGVTVAYRNRTPDEIRDIWTVNRRDGEWTAPRALHEDGWRIAGCPVNGPVLAAVDERVVAAWFTGAGGSPRVYAAFSDDGGDSFGTPALVDGDGAMGRVAAVMLADGSALVGWLASAGDNAEIRLRRLTPGGDAAARHFVAVETTAARAGGVPRMVHAGGRTVLAWTEAGENPRVHTAIVK